MEYLYTYSQGEKQIFASELCEKYRFFYQIQNKLTQGLFYFTVQNKTEHNIIHSKINTRISETAMQTKKITLQTMAKDIEKKIT